MLVRYLPLIAGIAPVLGVPLAYWLGIESGILPSCVPFLEGCVSVSATGRYLPGSLLFQAVMLPQVAILVFLWSFAAGWLRRLAPETKAPDAIVFAGTLGALALILYVTFLGTTGPFYEFMRRFGIYFYFLGTATAQLTLALSLLRHTNNETTPHLRRIAAAMLWLCGLPFALGILNLVLKSILDDADMAENRIEWIAALFMQAYFVVLYLAWRVTGFSVTVRTSNQGAD